MASSQLSDQIRSALSAGKNKEQVYSELLKEGKKIEEINSAFLDLNPQNKQEKLSASKILLILGGLVMILGGLTYIKINWQQWNQIMRVLAIFIPIFISQTIGAILWFKKNYEKQAIAFLVCSSLLFPLFLIVAFNEYKIYQGFPNAYGLAISLLSLIFFLIQSLIFSHPIWAFISSVAGLFVYHFVVYQLKLDKYFKNYPVAWIYLIPAVFYLFLGFFYQKKGLLDRARYLFMVGAVASIISFIYIFGFGYVKQTNTWLLILASGGYFMLAAFFEANKQKENSSTLYVISSITFFASLLKLAILGDLLKNIMPQLDNRSLVGFSLSISGIIYLLASYGLPKLIKFGLEGPTQLAKFFEVAGTFSTLGGIFHLGLGGKKIIYETLLLILSLGFIFGSIFNQSRAFLYSGTLFLVIYIFDIGGEYFQNQVGWPLTLFVAGLISMIVGFGIEKLRKEYFK